MWWLVLSEGVQNSYLLNEEKHIRPNQCIYEWIYKHRETELQGYSPSCFLVLWVFPSLSLIPWKAPFLAQPGTKLKLIYKETTLRDWRRRRALVGPDVSPQALGRKRQKRIARDDVEMDTNKRTLDDNAQKARNNPVVLDLAFSTTSLSSLGDLISQQFWTLLSPPQQKVRNLGILVEGWRGAVVGTTKG